MYVYYCAICRYQFISEPDKFFYPNGTNGGQQVQYFIPNCPNCLKQGLGYGNVQLQGEYIPAPTLVVKNQPVYNRAVPRLSASNPTQASNSQISASSSQASATSGASNLRTWARVASGTGVISKTGATSMAVVPAKVPVVVGTDWSKKLSEELTRYIMRFLDERSLALVGRVCKLYRSMAVQLLQKFVPPMVACGSSLVKLKDVLANELRGVKTVSLAVDKFSANAGKGSIIALLIEKRINLSLTLGEQNDGTLQLLSRGLSNFQAVPASERFHKMHNKFWVLDHDGVVTGSPNVTFSGLEGGNIETFIIIRSPRVASLFTQYLALLRTKDDPFQGAEFDALKDALAVYNSQDHQLKLAMAPVVNITDFVLENLQGATKITIREFLISPRNRRWASGEDILSLLCGMAAKGVEIEVFLDEGQYNAQDFVKKAVIALLRAGCKVFVQKPVKVVAASEGLMHDKLILATLHNGVKRTLLGSAGFTIDVIANENAENFICTDVQSVYESCLAHHRKTLELFPPKPYVLSKHG